MGPSTTRRTVAAWIEFTVVGSPSVPPVPQIYLNNFAGPHGFPKPGNWKR